MRRSPKAIAAAIKRLEREIADIDEFFYKANEGDSPFLHEGMLGRKRDDMVRSGVLQLHTAIEDLLSHGIVFRLVGAGGRSSRSQAARALRKLLFGPGSLGFDAKLNLAIALRFINSTTKDKLVLLNTLRNKCSHNWLLKVRVRRGRRPAQRKPPFLHYKGRDLYGIPVFKDFVGEYNGIYLKLFLKCY